MESFQIEKSNISNALDQAKQKKQNLEKQRNLSKQLIQSKIKDAHTLIDIETQKRQTNAVNLAKKKTEIKKINLLNLCAQESIYIAI